MKIHTIYKNTYRIQAFSSVSIFYPRTDFTRRRNIRFPLRFKIFSRARVRIVSAKFPMAPGQTVQTEEKIFTNWRQVQSCRKFRFQFYQDLSRITHRRVRSNFHYLLSSFIHLAILIIRNKIFHLHTSSSLRDSHRVLPFRFIHPGQCVRHPTPSLCGKAWLAAIPKAFQRPVCVYFSI